MVVTYILDDDGNPVPCPDGVAWARWFEKANRVVANDRLEGKLDGVTISTVFLGFDHNFSGKGPPVLWETMIFGGEHNRYQDHYTSRANALAGHAYAVALAKGEVQNPFQDNNSL